MQPSLLLLLASLVSLAPVVTQDGEPAPDAPEAGADLDVPALPETTPPILAVDIQAHVDVLAADALGGRDAASPDGHRAAAYVAAAFEALGLEPAGDEGTYFQAVDERYSPNVIGLLRGARPGAVVLGAHYDHLAPRGSGKDAHHREPDGDAGADRIFNGADDNASGVAAVLEIAQAFAARRERPGRTLVFVAFTAEEKDLDGSRYFVEHSPVELAELRGMINLDMISRGEENLVFSEARPKSSPLVEAMRRVNERVGLDVRFGEHPEWIMQSDHLSFIRKKVPAIYFGVEDHEDYHRVSDHADKILPGLAAKIAELAYGIAAELTELD